MTLEPKIVIILRCHLIKKGIFQWMVLDDTWYFHSIRCSMVLTMAFPMYYVFHGNDHGIGCSMVLPMVWSSSEV